MIILASILLGLLILIALGLGYAIFQWIEFRRTYGFRPFWENVRHYRFAQLPLQQIIEHAQDAAGIRLTWGAREMLTIPILEYIELKGRVDWEEVDNSIRDLMRTMAEDQSSQHLPGNSRNSIALIRGFHKRFCNIPPFCSRKEG